MYTKIWEKVSKNIRTYLIIKKKKNLWYVKNMKIIIAKYANRGSCYESLHLLSRISESKTHPWPVLTSWRFTQFCIYHHLQWTQCMVKTYSLVTPNYTTHNALKQNTHHTQSYTKQSQKHTHTHTHTLYKTKHVQYTLCDSHSLQPQKIIIYQSPSKHIWYRE